MPATGQDVTQWQGDTRELDIKITDNDGNPPTDLAGIANARWWAGKTPQSTGADILVKKDIGSGGITTSYDGTFFHLHVILDPPDTQNTPPGMWYHEAEVVASSGGISRTTIGRFIVKPSLIPASLG